MKTLLALASVLLAALTLVPVASAKRRAPQPVPPVVRDGVRYEAPLEKMGAVEAWSEGSGALLWEVRVYEVAVDPNLERDVQDVYIASLALAGGDLVVTDERDRVFLVDLETRKVRAK